MFFFIYNRVIFHSKLFDYQGVCFLLTFNSIVSTQEKPTYECRLVALGVIFFGCKVKLAGLPAVQMINVSPGLTSANAVDATSTSW